MRHSEFSRLVDVIEKLRDPKDGCPWDLKQTHDSLLKYLIEESYEFLHAAEAKDDEKMCEELGDVLLQIVLHSVVARQRGTFTIDDVCKGIADKIVRRHPHVFKEVNKDITADGVVEKWQEIKKEEKGSNSVHYRIDPTYLTFPALFSANKIGKKTNEIKFDWKDYKDVAGVVEGEWGELKEELKQDIIQNKDRIEDELGDILFSLAQLGRHLDIDPENALRRANKKFLRRFNKMEELIAEAGENLEQMNQMEMDVYWGKVKKLEKAQKA